MICPITGDRITSSSGLDGRVHHFIHINPSALRHQQEYFRRHQPSPSHTSSKNETRPLSSTRSQKRQPTPRRNTGGYYDTAAI